MVEHVLQIGDVGSAYVHAVFVVGAVVHALVEVHEESLARNKIGITRIVSVMIDTFLFKSHHQHHAASKYRNN